MKVEKLDIVRFAPKGNDSFYDSVVSKVKDYFEGNDISPFANTAMWVKTFTMLLLYFVPYIAMVTGAAGDNSWLFLGCWFVMGLGMIGIGTSVMHDANHGTYSPNKKVNNTIGYILEIVGGYTVTWKIQHNLLHHTYTNIAGLDDDIDSIVLLRFSPRQPRYWFHRYQYLYAWFFYMMMTLYWMTAKDYLQVVRYKQHELLVKHKVSLRQALFRITLYKLFYYGYILVLPLLFSGMPWYTVLAGFVIMHFIAGLFLSCIFQPSHIMEESAFAAPLTTADTRHMADSWAVHELGNTTNFSPNSRILSWFIGGLNYQIEHHLFTKICHVHYPKIAPIVKSTAIAFGLPYHEQPTFLKALLQHAKMLKKLGEEDF
ncbi:fatty acid desaturase family protein [Parapedobacter sp. DT-150]|uniref:fatty acid desaturase family protein n=1 Tax=Parapedobacter sp. DT-150 TaxID=3396162 RepID=UPI003F1E2D47